MKPIGGPQMTSPLARSLQTGRMGNRFSPADDPAGADDFRRLGLGVLGRVLAGTSSGPPEDGDRRLSPQARNRVAQAFADIGPEPVVDYHVHILGRGTGGSGIEVNPSLLSRRHPCKWFKTRIFLRACGVGDWARVDQDYVERVIRLARNFGHPLKLHLVALDQGYQPDGTLARSPIDFYVPNEYVVRLSELNPDLFVCVVSIHPDRPDALDEVAKWAARGVRFVKWLPNAQGIDPSLPRYDAFYERLRAERLVLLTHTGMERSVASHSQAFGNPLLLRRPLDRGVTVIMAHCACSGRSADLDGPGKTADNFDLFLRMMSIDRYRGLLFADLSAMTQINRTPRPILTMIRRPDLHDRLVNGSDYPLPALNCMIWTRQLAWLSLIDDSDRRCLNEIYALNPLLFDYVLKRTLRDPITGNRLPASLFKQNPGFRS